MAPPTATSTPMTVKEYVQQTIREALISQQDFTSVDLLREFQRQSELLGETERIRELLISDPFEHWKENSKLSQKISSLGERLQVVDVHRVVTLSGYSFIHAVLNIPVSSSEERKQNVKEKLKKKMQRCNMDEKLSTTTITGSTAPAMQLTFRYERRAEDCTRRIDPGIDPPTVWYSIDLSDGIRPVQSLLWVQVWADGHRRAEHLAAVNLEEDGDADADADGWEDIDDEDEDGEEDMKQEQKRQRMEDENVEQREKSNDPSSLDATTERADRYVAGIDPDVLQTFVRWIGLMGTDGSSEVTIFFLLMTFPFFEHEWDIIGYLLESVFGSASDDDDDNDEEKNEMDDKDEDD